MSNTIARRVTFIMVILAVAAVSFLIGADTQRQVWSSVPTTEPGETLTDDVSGDVLITLAASNLPQNDVSRLLNRGNWQRAPKRLYGVRMDSLVGSGTVKITKRCAVSFGDTTYAVCPNGGIATS